ncbi:MAG TPA: hypothetical protein VNZ45_05365 [Bacteroidia bacterium]|jgi:hypothetical protein|nr:hypothetical protein [Bacteroidia bacterium]
MKYENVKVLIPYFDGGMKNWAVIKFEGTADTRLIKRVIRKYVKQMFNKRVDDNFIKFDCRWIKNTQADKNTVRISEAAKAVTTFLQDEHEDIINEQAGTDSLPQGQAS